MLSMHMRAEAAPMQMQKLSLHLTEVTKTPLHPNWKLKAGKANRTFQFPDFSNTRQVLRQKHRY